MYLQMLCNTPRAVSLTAAPKVREPLGAGMINCEYTASQGMVSHTKGQRTGSTILGSSPASATQVKGVFKGVFKGLLLLFQADFLWLC